MGGGHAERLTMDKPTKVVGRRVVGYIIDSIVYSLVIAASWWLLTDKIGAGLDGGIKIGDTRHAFTSGHASNRTVWVIIIAAFAILYFIVIPGITGKTIGKWLTGTTIVRADGRPPGIWRQFVREFMWIIDGLFVNLVAFITAMASKNHQRVGDMLAKTYVVRSAAAGTPIQLEGQAPGPGIAAPAPPSSPPPG
jgi:uncharacterized RDD family membrane protein YckC